MDISIGFLLLSITLVSAWFAPRGVTMVLFAISLIVSIGIFLHHATDTLPLSF